MDDAGRFRRTRTFQDGLHHELEEENRAFGAVRMLRLAAKASETSCDDIRVCSGNPLA